MSNITEFILSLEDLMIFLNILYHRQCDVITVYPYFLEEGLFRISLGEEGQITRLIEREAYQRRYHELLDSLEEEDEREGGVNRVQSNIIPPFKILRKCLVGSGLWKLENWDELKLKLDEIERQNPLRGDRINFIGFDTNCFMNRLFSCIEREYKGNLSKFGFVLSRIVHSELRSTRKIGQRELDLLKEKLPQKREFLDEFWNRDTLQTRLKTIGLVEFNKVKVRSNYIINDGVIRDARENDIQIIEDLHRQSREKNADLVLVTSDEQFHRNAREPGITSYYLKPPPINEMPYDFTGTWEQVCHLLYLLSIYFGGIILRAKNTFHLFGVWRGKSTDAWDSESVKIQIMSSRITTLLTQQMRILSS
ncbi:MAG: hypothetical protein ACTSRS_09805 [Candidatus Helarchaeota archaeon]